MTAQKIGRTRNSNEKQSNIASVHNYYLNCTNVFSCTVLNSSTGITEYYHYVYIIQRMQPTYPQYNKYNAEDHNAKRTNTTTK